jgi:hypothetical protein
MNIWARLRCFPLALIASAVPLFAQAQQPRPSHAVRIFDKWADVIRRSGTKAE